MNNLKKILVIGDSCRDIFVYCSADRLCPDIPVPVLNILNQTENGGMAKNVQRNILTQIENCDIITNVNWQQITKTRYVHAKTNHTFLRVDNNIEVVPLNVQSINLNYDIIVISDYNKGFIAESDIEYICNAHPCVFIDTKKILSDWAKSAKFIKINEYEYKRSESFIQKNLHLEDKIICTLGERGCRYKNSIFKVKSEDIKDTTGAGDSFLAALVIKYLHNNNIENAICYANECAARVVKSRGVTLI